MMVNFRDLVIYRNTHLRMYMYCVLGLVNG